MFYFSKSVYDDMIHIMTLARVLGLITKTCFVQSSIMQKVNFFVFMIIPAVIKFAMTHHEHDARFI